MKTKKRIFLIGAVLSFISIVALFISMAVVTRAWSSLGVYTWLKQDSDFILDGSGGIILAGVKGTTSNPNIYSQRINPTGTRALGTGRAVCTALRRQERPHLVSDGAGGAIIVWEDWRNYGFPRTDIYAQRIEADGDRVWSPSNGIIITNAMGWQVGPDLISDGSGGAIIFWHDDMNGGDIYAQRVDSAGNLLWAPYGVPICSAAGLQRLFRFVSDGNGGVIITWVDEEVMADANIYAQRVDLDGNILWEVRGVPICIEAGTQWGPSITSDGNGGAIITWHDYRGGYTHVYAQRIDADGNLLWASGGVRISTSEIPQVEPDIVSDGSGGAVITWHGGISSWEFDINAQRIDAEGNLLWDPSGVLLCGETGNQINPEIAPYNFNSFIVVWQDYRGGSSRNVDIYAQGINLNGTVLWDPGGIVVIDNTRDNRNPEILPDGIVKWQDVTYNRTYVQKISYIPEDIDEDGLPNEVDLDDDGDGFRDGSDPSGDTTRDPGVVACYEFNYARDINADTIPDLGFDSSGNNNTLTNVNGVESVASLFGNGARFTADNQTYLTIPPEQQNNLHITGDMTVSAWINITDFPIGNFIIAARLANSDLYSDYTFYVVNDGTNRMGSWNGSIAVFSDAPVPLGSWHHVAFVRSGNQITFYLDGEEIGSSTQEFPNTVEGAPFFVGSNSAANTYANGLIDELAIYNRALTPAEISEFGT